MYELPTVSMEISDLWSHCGQRMGCMLWDFFLFEWKEKLFYQSDQQG